MSKTKIIEPHDKSGWITVVIEGRWCQAKIYNLSSKYGINGGRISILAIGKFNMRINSTNFLIQLDYYYSRGLDFDNLPNGVLDTILEQLEALPLKETK